MLADGWGPGGAGGILNQRALLWRFFFVVCRWRWGPGRRVLKWYFHVSSTVAGIPCAPALLGSADTYSWIVKVLNSWPATCGCYLWANCESQHSSALTESDDLLIRHSLVHPSQWFRLCAVAQPNGLAPSSTQMLAVRSPVVLLSYRKLEGLSGLLQARAPIKNPGRMEKSVFLTPLSAINSEPSISSVSWGTDVNGILIDFDWVINQPNRSCWLETTLGGQIDGMDRKIRGPFLQKMLALHFTNIILFTHLSFLTTALWNR